MNEWIKLKEPIKFGDFRNTENAKSGVLIKYDNEKIELIGDINPSGGYCECCSMWDRLVVAYKVVWNKEE